MIACVINASSTEGLKRCLLIGEVHVCGSAQRGLRPQRMRLPDCPVLGALPETLLTKHLRNPTCALPLCSCAAPCMPTVMQPCR